MPLYLQYYYDESARQYTRRDEAKKKAGVPVAVKNHASRHIEQGESSQNGRAMNDDINTHYFFWNKNSWATVYKLKARPGHGKHRKAGTKIYFVDRGCPGYRWLPEGWLAEVRRMASNRFYTVRKLNCVLYVPTYVSYWFSDHSYCLVRSLFFFYWKLLC